MRAGMALAGFFLILATNAHAENLALQWGNIKSPYLREVLYDFAQHKYYSAVGRLLAERWRGSVKPEKTQSELMLAYAYLAYGMHADATIVLQQLPQNSLTDETRNQLLLELANMRYQRGDLPGANKAIQKISGSISEPLQHRKIVFEAILLSQQKQHEPAIAKLRTLSGSSEWATLGYFNLGTTLLRMNQRAEGEEWLRRVANGTQRDNESQALRDRANFILGFSALRAQAVLQAKNYFQKIALDSPFSSRALLGMGLTFEELREPKQALAAWLELARRNAADRAVLEGLLAVPYAYSELGGHDQAVGQYKVALDTFQTELNNVEATMAQVKSGQLINTIVDHLTQARAEAFNEYQSFPAIPEATYLQGLYESHAFQTALRNYRDLRLMEKQLAGWARSIYALENTSDTFKKVYVDQIANKQTKLVTAAEETKQYIGRLAQAELEKRHGLLLTYARDALFKMGQVYDRGANAADRAARPK